MEEGVAPEQLTGTHLTKGVVDLSRPLCLYPQVAEYSGSGSTDDAENWSCVNPE